MEIHNEIIIERPIEEVFEFLMNFENMPRWNYYIQSVKNETEGPIKVGSTFHQVRKTDSQKYKIIELTYPRLVAIETLPPERYIILRFTLFQQGEHTRVEDRITVKVNALIGFFIKRKIRSAVKENLVKLKTLLEEGSVKLQDGRIIALN